ncbi:MAG: pyridoxal phosphate-dependent aminotransferase, partial [Flavobacteriales bacterium CG_4_9_14_0_2_um_filter_35_242]
ENLKEALELENIESRFLWKPMHTQPLYNEMTYFGDHTSDKLFKSGLCLPSGSSLSEADLKRITSIIINKISN